jgi:hypothetical protein
MLKMRKKKMKTPKNELQCMLILYTFVSQSCKTEHIHSTYYVQDTIQLLHICSIIHCNAVR